MTSERSSRVFQRNPRIEEAPLQNELMLFDPESSKFFVLNATMAWVWKNVGSADPDTFAVNLTGHFADVTEAQASRDVEEALQELQKLGLIVNSDTQIDS